MIAQVKKIVILLLLCEIFGHIYSKESVSDFFSREICYDELGCFSAAAPFFDIIERPVSLLPDDRVDINTRFLLFTPDYPKVPMNFSNLDLSLKYLPRSGFNPNIETKFVVPGFMSHLMSVRWQMPLIQALISMKPCNVILVDWHGGEGPLYEQAVANTRVVGAEIALFIQKLQDKTGIKPESVHIIGHSLGSHIAGYAGKRLSKLGRITALDPAGPYFTSVDPIVRLDRNDANFVDAIHTNAAPSRFQGFGLTESIAHFDFYPNGGHLQPGCMDMGDSIWEFLKHPSIDEDGMHEISCNHERAIHLFISSILHAQECSAQGTHCTSWENFASGKCGACASGTSKQLCVPMGMHADNYKQYIDQSRSINFYLNTMDSEPFCKAL